MIGFAPFNRPVAKIFLGDVGSLPIGLLLGWCLLELLYRHHLAAALLLPLYYLADATVTLLRRLAAARSGLDCASLAFLSASHRQRPTVFRIVSEVFALNVGSCGIGDRIDHDPLSATSIFLLPLEARRCILYCASFHGNVSASPTKL